MKEREGGRGREMDRERERERERGRGERGRGERGRGERGRGERERKTVINCTHCRVSLRYVMCYWAMQLCNNICFCPVLSIKTVVRHI